MGEKKMDGKMLDKKDVAQYFGVTIRAIEGWMQKANLPYYKIGHCVRFELSEIEKWKKERRVSNG